MSLYGNNSTTLTGTEIEVGSGNGYGILAYNYERNGSLTLNGNTKIKTTGSSSYGIYVRNIFNTTGTITMNDGEIDSNNIGIYIAARSYSGYTPRVDLNINKGTIKGSNYGIYQAIDVSTINVGRASDELSIENPFIDGGLY